MSRDCCVALPYDTMDLSAVCDCGIPDHTHLLFLLTRTVASFLRYTGYINVTKDPISHVLLLILIYLLLLSRIY